MLDTYYDQSCWFFKMGRCAEGNECLFRHDIEGSGNEQDKNKDRKEKNEGKDKENENEELVGAMALKNDF